MDYFKDLVWDNMILAAKISLFAAVPVLKIWPLSWITEYIIDQLSDHLYKVGKEFLDMENIILKNQEAKDAFTHGVVVLKIIARGKGIESKEFQDARKENIVKMSDFVRRRRAA